MNHYAGLEQAIAKFEQEFPGWWWRVGYCHLSSDASIAPDYNDAAHAERLFKSFPVEKFDAGFHADIRNPSSCAAALEYAMEMAREAISEITP